MAHTAEERPTRRSGKGYNHYSGVSLDRAGYSSEKFWNRLRIRPLFGEDGSLLYFAAAQNPIRPDEVRSGPIADIRE
jgi:hypothetical protein